MEPRPDDRLGEHADVQHHHAVAVGAGLLIIVVFGRGMLNHHETVISEGYASAFAVLGGILAATGLHMTLNWPLAVGGFAFDNIIFGETSLGFGALLLASSAYLWRHGPQTLAGREPIITMARTRPISVFVFLLGLSLIAIAIAGVRYQLFAAPPQEPISGAFADYPLVEAIFMSGIIALVGIGAIAFPFMTSVLASGRDGGPAAGAVGWSWTISGALLGLFGAMNFYTHIGLIINTM